MNSDHEWQILFLIAFDLVLQKTLDFPDLDNAVANLKTDKLNSLCVYTVE